MLCAYLVALPLIFHLYVLFLTPTLTYPEASNSPCHLSVLSDWHKIDTWADGWKDETQANPTVRMERGGDGESGSRMLWMTKQEIIQRWIFKVSMKLKKLDHHDESWEGEKPHSGCGAENELICVIWRVSGVVRGPWAGKGKGWWRRRPAAKVIKRLGIRSKTWNCAMPRAFLYYKKRKSAFENWIQKRISHS